MSSFFRSKPAASAAGAASPARTSHVLRTPNIKAPLLSKPPRTAEEEKHRDLYDQLVGEFSEVGFEVDVGGGEGGGEADGGRRGGKRRLGKGERMWLTEECFWRYVMTN